MVNNKFYPYLSNPIKTAQGLTYGFNLSAIRPLREDALKLIALKDYASNLGLRIQGNQLGQIEIIKREDDVKIATCISI